MLPLVGAVACRPSRQAGVRGALYAHTARGRLPVEPAKQGAVVPLELHPAAERPERIRHVSKRLSGN